MKNTKIIKFFSITLSIFCGIVIGWLVSFYILYKDVYVSFNNMIIPYPWRISALFFLLFSIIILFFTKRLKTIIAKIQYIKKFLLILSVLLIFLYGFIFIKNKIIAPRGPNVIAHKGPNVILLFLDALRADHLGCYGYSRNTSEHIDSLASKGVVIKNVISAAPSTFPSVPATLTSKYASNFFPISDSLSKSMLEEKHLTLAEILRNIGYYTIAVSSSPIVAKKQNSRSLGGFEQGFNIFDESVTYGLTRNWQYRSPEGVIDKAIKYLNTFYRQSFFLFLYIEDPHCNYKCPKPYCNLYDPGYTGKKYISRGCPTYYEKQILRGEKTDLNNKDIKHLIALYDGEITYADAQ